jgi:hypothetical protein
MPRKPRGINGPVRITSGADSVEFIPNELPDAKPAIEKVIIDGSRVTQSAMGADPWSLIAEPVQLEESSFDFELPTRAGKEHLDLVEFAPLSHYGGSYEKAPNKHNVGELADAYWALIKRKSAHYGASRRARVHLLVYITDFRFLPSETTFAVLEALLNRKRHDFLSVSFYSPIDTESGMFRELWPKAAGAGLSHNDERLLRAHVFTNLDNRKMKMSEDRRSAFFEAS